MTVTVNTTLHDGRPLTAAEDLAFDHVAEDLALERRAWRNGQTPQFGRALGECMERLAEVDA